MKTRELQLKIMREYAKECDFSNLVTNVINIVEKESDSPMEYLNNVVMHGCVSGSVRELIFMADTYRFFIKNMDDIFGLISELINDMDDNSFIKDINYNSLSWLAFEEIAGKLINVLDDYEEQVL